MADLTLSFEPLSGGRVRHGKWVPDHRCRMHSRLNVTAPPTPLPWNAPRMLLAYNASRDHEAEDGARGRLYNVMSVGQSAKQCAERPGPSTRHPAPSTWRCESSTFVGVRLLLGVVTAPRNRMRRDAIRGSWSKWPGRASLVCFAVGVGGLAPALRTGLNAEQAEFGDLVMLPEVSDVCHASIAKAHAWWRFAASTGVPYVGRVDDDTFVHVPNLESDLESLYCHPQLVYGVSAFVGYNPTTFRKCGYSWSGNRAWRKYGCGATGAHEAAPFVSGMLQVLSRGLAHTVASSEEVRAFVARASAVIDMVTWDKTEDVVLGYWLVQLLLSGAIAPLVHLAALEPGRGHNLGCRKQEGFYQRPSNRSRAIHFVKKPQGMMYLYGVMRGQHAHEITACRKAAGVD